MKQHITSPIPSRALLCASLGLGLSVSTSLFGALTASFDTDSYVFIGTNNAFDPFVSVGEDIGAPGHFNFGVIEFDLTGLPASDDYFLKLTPSIYPAPGFPPSGPPQASGFADLNVSVLGADFTTSYLPSTSKLAWYLANVKGGTSAGAVTVTDQNTIYLDVTSAVEAWRTGTPNYGFGIWSSLNSVDLWSSNGTPGLGPELTLEAVPEPSTIITIMSASLLALLIMRKRPL